MKSVVQIGNPPWTREEAIESLEEFCDLYANRPIQDNTHGMKTPHMFATWFMVKRLSPDLIIESGVWKGQGTWLLEQACPDAKIVSIDLNLDAREYISDRVVYSNNDFAEQDWSDVTERSLVFFDDHQNAYRRIQQCRWFGFKHIVFEDNYPASQGDCYSLKKIFEHAGFTPSLSSKSTEESSFTSKVKRKIARLLGVNPITLMPQYDHLQIKPNSFDATMLKKHLDCYYEFPPVFKPDVTRWGDRWDDGNYPTPLPLLDHPKQSFHNLIAEEATAYTWICYAKLK